MLEAVFEISSKEQIDERTIRYCSYRKDGKYGLTPYYIYKYKCPYGKNIYFFQFPPLYNNQGTTVYKAVKQD